MDSTFLAMLSGAPSLLQSYNQDAHNSKQDTYVAKIAIDDNDIHVNAIGNEMSKNFSELSPNIATNGSLSSSSFPKVLSAACCSSNSSYREGVQTRTLNYHSSDMTGSLTNHLIRADRKVINLLKSESGCTGQANNGKIHLLNTQISEKLPFEANLQSVHRPSAASLDGFPRVSCFGTSGNLLFSKPGVLGVVCSCHCLHMSVSTFCEHSGLISHNPGHAVHMASGETIGQWRELYFKAIGLRVPDDQDGWDWPEGFPTAAGFVNSSFISSEMQKNANISHLVSSHRVSTKPLEHSDNANLPNDLNLAMDFVTDGYQNKLHKSDHGSHIFVKESAPSLFNCHTLQDNQVTCVTDSRNLTMSKFIAAGTSNGIEGSSCYTSSTTKGGHLSVPDSTLQTSKNIGIGFDLRKVGMARDSASVDRKVVSSHIKLKLGQPCQQTWAFGNSAQPIVEPTQSFSKVAAPLKPVTSVDATERKELGKYFQPYAGSSYLKRKEMHLKNHPYGMNTAAEAKQATIGTDISKVSAVSSVPFSQAIPEANIHIGAFDNRINGSIGTEKPQSYSSTVNYDSINDPLIFGCNLETQPGISNMSFHRAFDKGVGSHSSMEIPCISCIWGAPRTVVDGKNYCLQEKIMVHESGHKQQSVSGNTSKSMDFESAPWSQPPLLGTSSYVLDKILDLSKQDKNSHFPVDNVRIPLVKQVSKLQQQVISDVRGCLCQQPSSPSNFRIQCSPVKPQITANMGHCQFPCGQQQSEAGFKPVEIGARNRICRGPLNEQTKMQSQYPLDLHQNEQTLAREKEVLVSEFEECTPKLPSADCFANWRGTTGTDWLLGGSVVGTERISQGQLVMEGREDFQFKSICSNNLDSLKEIAELMASNAMLDGKITSNGLCHSAQWKDAPEKGERRNNLSLLDHTRFLQDRREDNGMQLDDTHAERINGSIEVSHACGEEDGSNLSAGCSSTAVTQTSVGIKKMSSPLDTQNIGGSNDLPGDEGSVIGDCCSSYDASESRRSSKFKEIGHGSKPRRMSCRFMGSNLHHGLLDELKAMNSLTWKKGQKCVHKEHFHLESAKCSDMLEQSSKKGRKRKMKVVNSPSLSAIGNSRDSGLSTHSLRFTGVGKGNITGDCSAKWCSSSDGEAPDACNDCFQKVSSKGCGSFISSSKSLSRKRSLQQLYIDTGKSQKKMKWMKDGEHYCDDLVNTGLKKSGRKHLSDQTCELTHADTSVLSAASAWQMKVHWPWMRPVASGLFGEISPGEPDPDMMKPAKIVCLSKILETSRRCKVPKDTQSFISGLNKNTLENYVAIDMQSDTLNGENQNTYNVVGDCTFKHKGLDAETERVCSQGDKSTKRYRRGPGICSDIHSSSKSKRVRVRSLNELSLQENKREIVKNPDSRSCVEEKCKNTTNKYRCYVEPTFGSHKGAMACVEKSEFTCARTEKEYARYKQARGWKHLVVYKSSIHALGLYTSRFIYHGEMVVEYIGEIVGQRVADKREKEYQSGKRVQYKSACYFFRIDKEHIIDATQKGGIARFVNHSCQPNCVAKVISLKNEKKVVFFAERDIFPGEEITYDYHFNHEDEGKKIPCYCNAKNCRRYMN